MKFDGKLKTILHFPVLIFVIIVIIAINGCFFVTSYHQMNQTREEITHNAEQQKWEIVKDEIFKEYTLSSADIKFLSKKIECAILRQYGSNMDALKQDFQNKNFDQELFNLFKQQLETDSTSPNTVTKDDSFNYILGFQDSIMAIFSDKNKENISNCGTWAEYFNASANVQLNESLVSNIVNKNLTENLLLYQNSNLNTNKTLINSHDIDSLEAIYREKGLEGFKDIEFVNVAYITEYGDIFGTDDYLYLEKVSNYKMILVRTSNIYDTINKSTGTRLKQFDAETNLLLVRLSEDITRKSLQFVTVSLCLLALVIIFGGFYNKDIQKQ